MSSLSFSAGDFCQFRKEQRKSWTVRVSRCGSSFTFCCGVVVQSSLVEKVEEVADGQQGDNAPIKLSSKLLRLLGINAIVGRVSFQSFPIEFRMGLIDRRRVSWWRRGILRSSVVLLMNYLAFGVHCFGLVNIIPQPDEDSSSRSEDPAELNKFKLSASQAKWGALQRKR